MYDQITDNKRLVLVGGISLTLTVMIIIADSATFPRSSSLLPVSVFASAGNFTRDSLVGALYVENTQSNSISVIDPATNAIVTNITLGEAAAAFDIKLSEDQLTLYLTDMHSGTVTRINTTNYEPAGQQISTGVSVYNIANFNGTLYVGDVFGGKILVMNENGTVIDTIKVGSGPQYIEVRPDGEILYVANLWSPISVVDLKQNKMIKEIDSGDTPHGLSFTNDGARLFLVNTKSDTLSVIDAYKHEIIKTIPVGDNPQYVALTPDEMLACVTNMDSDTVSIVDAQEIEVINEIRVGNGPNGIAFSVSGGGDLAYVSNMRGNNVSVINATSGRVIATIPAGGVGPDHIVAINPNIEIVRTADNINNNYNSSVIARVFVEVADDQDETMRGLMFRKHLPWNAGMLFVFHNEELQTFWMKNTFIPLDMIFVDSNSKIVDIKENVPPCAQGDECPLYPSKQPAQYVLEVNAGFVQENGIKIEDQLAVAN